MEDVQISFLILLSCSCTENSNLGVHVCVWRCKIECEPQHSLESFLVWGNFFMFHPKFWCSCALHSSHWTSIFLVHMSFFFHGLWNKQKLVWYKFIASTTSIFILLVISAGYFSVVMVHCSVLIAPSVVWGIIYVVACLILFVLWGARFCFDRYNFSACWLRCCWKFELVRILLIIWVSGWLFCSSRCASSVLFLTFLSLLSKRSC